MVVNTSLPAFDLPALSGYTGVFMGGYLGAYDAAVLTNYVNGGGNVYLMAGTGTAGDEGTVWDSFLNNFGFEFGPSYNGIDVTQPITSGHPIFSGIGSLYFANGNTVNLAGGNPFASIVESSGGTGLIGVYDDTLPGEIPEPSTLGLSAAALCGLAWMMRRKQA
ncbi:MAG: PEP-CTERM sorting domain-containing protein [Rhodocyclaceae bacterium]|nr:PEP-CTERM sorting domain-containing protein [Rhodocyclaceae bacterium]